MANIERRVTVHSTASDSSLSKHYSISILWSKHWPNILSEWIQHICTHIRIWMYTALCITHIHQILMMFRDQWDWKRGLTTEGVIFQIMIPSKTSMSQLAVIAGLFPLPLMTPSARQSNLEQNTKGCAQNPSLNLLFLTFVMLKILYRLECRSADVDANLQKPPEYSFINLIHT